VVQGNRVVTASSVGEEGLEDMEQKRVRRLSSSTSGRPFLQWRADAVTPLRAPNLAGIDVYGLTERDGEDEYV
jgi:hypothetical protein